MKARAPVFTALFLTITISSCMAQSNKYKTVTEAKGLQAGDVVPGFTAMDQHDVEYELNKLLKKSPVVLIFIRGQWCPVCTKHITRIQDSLPFIYQKGASVAVVSPEKPEFLKKTIEKTGAEFTLLYDEGYKISDAFNVTFLPDSATRAIYNSKLSAKLKESHSDDSERLPIPATFIIGQNSKIKWRHFDPDYKKRASVKDILNNL